MDVKRYLFIGKKPCIFLMIFSEMSPILKISLILKTYHILKMSLILEMSPIQKTPLLHVPENRNE